MKAGRTNNSRGQEYLVMFRVYIQPDGSVVVVMGNQRMSVSPDEVHKLLMGTLDYARVFSELHNQIDATTLAILNENKSIVASSNGTLRVGVD